jgi:hypothetical protein
MPLAAVVARAYLGREPRAIDRLWSGGTGGKDEGHARQANP